MKKSQVVEFLNKANLPVTAGDVRKAGIYWHADVGHALSPAAFVDEAKNFVGQVFFDPGCPHCAPFLTDGAIIIHDHPVQGTFAVRLIGGGLFEAVFLKPGIVGAGVDRAEMLNGPGGHRHTRRKVSDGLGDVGGFSVLSVLAYGLLAAAAVGTVVAVVLRKQAQAAPAV